MSQKLRNSVRHSCESRNPSMFKTWIPAFAGMTFLFMNIPNLVFATSKNVGTSGAQFLRLGAGARPTAMGEAFVGIADDVNALYFNPAGAARLERPEIAATHVQWFEGMDYEYGAFALPTKAGAFGFSAATLQAKDLEKRGLDESYQGKFDTLDAAYGLTYARSLNPTWQVGGTLRYLKQEIDSASAGTWSGDVGTLKKLGDTPFSVGLAIRHFGEEVKFSEEGDPQPTVLDGGVGAQLFRKRLLLGFDLKVPRDNDVKLGLGSELNLPIAGDFKAALRAGYNNSAADAKGADGLSVGAGLGFRQFEMDFSWVPLGDLGDTFRYSALFRF